MKDEKKPFSLALVTGATSGIGEAVAYLLAEKGINLFLTGRNQDKLKQLKDELGRKVQVETIPADLSSEKERNELIKKIYEHAPDLVVNNAGFGLYGDALAYDTSDQVKILNVDGTVVLILSLESARAMRAKDKKGVIINISSASGAMPTFPGMAVYGASKAFVNQFSTSFDYELRPYGIRVLASCPGVVATDFRSRAGGKKSGSGKTPKVMTSAFAAEEIWRQIENRKQIYIFDWKYRFLTFLTKYIFPTSFVSKTIYDSVKSFQKEHLPHKF